MVEKQITSTKGYRFYDRCKIHRKNNIVQKDWRTILYIKIKNRMAHIFQLNLYALTLIVWNDSQTWHTNNTEWKTLGKAEYIKNIKGKEAVHSTTIENGKNAILL